MAEAKVGERIVSTYSSIDAAWWPYVFIFLAAALPTLIWRWLGVILVGNLDETSEVIVLVRCISTALVAAVVAQFVFHPTGALATLPLALRIFAAVSGFGVFLASRNLFASIVVGEGLLVGGALLL